jgi:WD40 repeat protein
VSVARLGTIRWRQPLREGSGFAQLVFSPDGKILASVGGSGLRLWEASSGKALDLLPDQERVVSVGFGSKGQVLLTEAPAGVLPCKALLQRYEIDSGKLLSVGPVSPTRDRLPPPLISADGTFVVLSEGGKLCARPIQKGAQGVDFDREPADWTVPALSADGRRLALVDREGWLLVYDTATAKELRRFSFARHVKNRSGSGVPALSPDGRLLAASTPESFRVWDTVSGELRLDVTGCHGIATFAGDGSYLACGDRKGIRLWDAASLREVRTCEEPPSTVRALAFSPDGKLLASAQDSAIVLWDVTTGKPLNGGDGHQGAVFALAFASRGDRLASGGAYGTAGVG